MKVKIAASNEMYSTYKEMLEKGGFTIDEEASLVLLEEEDNTIVVERRGTHKSIQIQDILYAESFGRYIFLNTVDDEFKITSRLYELEEKLHKYGFLRVSKSVIVHKDGIDSITPIINGRFDLHMLNNKVIVVTRSYRKSFKDYIGF